MSIKKEPPSREEVAKLRKQAGDSTLEAAERIYVSRRQWQHYESGASNMPPGLFELYRIKTGQI